MASIYNKVRPSQVSYFGIVALIAWLCFFVQANICKLWAGEMAHRGKALPARHEEQSSLHGTHVGKVQNPFPRGE